MCTNNMLLKLRKPILKYTLNKYHVHWLFSFKQLNLPISIKIPVTICTGGKPRNYHEIVLTQICSQATSGTRRGSFQAENWIKKGWCHVHFCFILQLRTNNGEIRQCSSV